MALGFLDKLFTRPGEEKRFDIYEPGQNQLLTLLQSILTGQGQQPQEGLLGSLLGEGGFEAFAGPARREFEERTVPGLAERFAGVGGLSSSGFQQALSGAGQDLSLKLGEMRGQQQQNLLGPLLQAVLAPRSNVQYIPGGPTGLATGLGSIFGGLGQGIGGLLGGKFF